MSSVSMMPRRMPTPPPPRRMPTHRLTRGVDGAHRSLQILPPPFGPERARPRAVVYVHLSGEALTAGAGVARVENVGPILLNRLRLLLGDHCSINLKPVIDLPSGTPQSTPTKSRPASANNSSSAIRPMCSPTPPRSADPST